MNRSFRNMIAAAASLAVLGWSPALADTPKAPEAKAEAPLPITAYRGVTLIDGTGARARANMTIVIEGTVIKGVFPTEGGPGIPAGAKVIDGTGLYALPGLIDTHVHLATPPNRKKAEATLRRELYSGVTAVRDMADDVRAISDLARGTLLQEVVGPDIYYAALMAGPSFFADPRTHQVSQGAKSGDLPWMKSVTEQTDMPLAIAMARGSGATGLKIYANLSGAMVDKITREAHRQGMLVWAHGMVMPATPAEVVAANVDVISHTCYIAYQAQPVRPSSSTDRVPLDMKALGTRDNPVLTALFKDMADKGIILDATVRLYVNEDRKNEAAGRKGGSACPSEIEARLTSQAYRAGVLIAAGTDGNTAWNDPYPALHEEIELLATKVGMTNLDAIRAATDIASRTIGKSEEMGTIAVGKLANLVFLSKDPVADIRNIRSVVLTVKRGTSFDRKDYVPVTKDELGDDE